MSRASIPRLDRGAMCPIRLKLRPPCVPAAPLRRSDKTGACIVNKSLYPSGKIRLNLTSPFVPSHLVASIFENGRPQKGTIAHTIIMGKGPVEV